MASYSNKSVLVTVTKEDGDTATGSRLLFVDRILSVETSGTKLKIKYDNSEGQGIKEYLTDTLTVTQLNNQINDLPTPGAREFVGVFDATGGKAIGTHNLLDLAGNPIIIPDNSRVIHGFYEVTTTFTSATDAGTMSIDIATDDVAGLLAAAAISTGTTFDAAAPKALIQAGTVSNISEKTTADRNATITVAVEALTAGVMYVWLKVITTA